MISCTYHQVRYECISSEILLSWVKEHIMISYDYVFALFQSELAKCEKLLEGGETEVFVHGLGGAVNRAVNLALQLESKFLGTVQLTVNTSTATLIGKTIEGIFI